MPKTKSVESNSVEKKSTTKKMNPLEEIFAREVENEKREQQEKVNPEFKLSEDVTVRLGDFLRDVDRARLPEEISSEHIKMKMSPFSESRRVVYYEITPENSRDDNDLKEGFIPLTIGLRDVTISPAKASSWGSSKIYTLTMKDKNHKSAEGLWHVKGELMARIVNGKPKKNEFYLGKKTATGAYANKKSSIESTVMSCNRPYEDEVFYNSENEELYEPKKNTTYDIVHITLRSLSVADPKKKWDRRIYYPDWVITRAILNEGTVSDDDSDDIDDDSEDSDLD